MGKTEEQLFEDFKTLSGRSDWTMEDGVLEIREKSVNKQRAL
jgi:hypothetical protein